MGVMAVWYFFLTLARSKKTKNIHELVNENSNEVIIGMLPEYLTQTLSVVYRC